MNPDPSSAIPSDPLSDSILGEYARMLMVGTAGCSTIASAVRMSVDPNSVILVLGNVFVVASLISSRLAATARLLLLTGFAAALSWIFLQAEEPSRWWSPVVFFSPAMLLASLIILAVRESTVIFRTRQWTISYRSLGIFVFATCLLMYMIVIPSIDAYLERFRQRPSSYTIEELTVFEQLRIRTAKFAVFAFFAYLGACVASFINVIAASAPRGESITFRTSACPKCQTPIRRIDNLPLYSYLNLGGRCRSCATKIPVRYFLVEIVGATIFGSLFLYELVTGAANIPGFQHYNYVGILWIILYTKWPVVGIYLFHVAMFSCLLMLALMDLDRLRCPKWIALGMLAVFASLSIFVATLQPVAFDDQSPFLLSQSMPDWSVRLLTCIIGGGAGWTLASITQRLVPKRELRRFPRDAFPLGAALVGIVLGWQAMITIAFLIAIAIFLSKILRRWFKRGWRIPASLWLFVVAMFHHPAWKWLTRFWP